jgi:hypothetical protein
MVVMGCVVGGGRPPPVSDGGRVKQISRVPLVGVAGYVPAPGLGGLGPISPDMHLSTFGAGVCVGHGDMLEPHALFGTADAADWKRSVSDGQATVVYGAGLEWHRVVGVKGGGGRVVFPSADVLTIADRVWAVSGGVGSPGHVTDQWGG